MPTDKSDLHLIKFMTSTFEEANLSKMRPIEELLDGLIARMNENPRRTPVPSKDSKEKAEMSTNEALKEAASWCRVY